MKIKLKIKQPGYVDGQEHYNTTSFLMSHSEHERGYGSWRRNQFGEDVHTSERHGYSYAKRAEDPVFAGLSSTLDDIIFKNSNDYAHEVEINGPSKVIYSPDKPLSCGAKVWVETEAEVNLK